MAMSILRTGFLLLLLCATPLALYAQKSEIGIGPSTFLYSGDLNATPEPEHTQVGGRFFYRYHASNFTSLRFAISIGNLKGNDTKEQNTDILANQRQASFNIGLAEVSATFEYFFLDYQNPDNIIKGSPYIFFGLGGMLFWGDEESEASYSHTQPVIPFGIGYKYLLNRKLALSLSAAARKTFFDYLDNTSAENFSDKDFSFGEQYSTDWYYSIDLTISFVLYNINCPPNAPLY